MTLPKTSDVPSFGGTEVVQVREGVWTVVGYSLNNCTFVEGETGLIASYRDR